MPTYALRTHTQYVGWFAQCVRQQSRHNELTHNDKNSFTESDVNLLIGAQSIKWENQICGVLLAIFLSFFGRNYQEERGKMILLLSKKKL